MSLPGVNPKKLAMQVFDKRGGKELLKHKAEQELTAVSIANTLIEHADGDTISPVPNADMRADQLTRGIVSLVDGDIEGFYAQEWARQRAACDPADVLPYVDLTVDEWNSQKERWHAGYDVDGFDAEDVAAHHVGLTFGVHIDEFVAEVVAWHDGRDAEVIERFLAGDPYDQNRRVFVGHRTAHQGMQWALGELYDE